MELWGLGHPALQGIFLTPVSFRSQRGRPGWSLGAGTEVVGWQAYLLLSKRAPGQRPGKGNGGGRGEKGVSFWLRLTGQGWEWKFQTSDQEALLWAGTGTFLALGLPCLSDNRMISKGHSSSCVRF